MKKYSELENLHVRNSLNIIAFPSKIHLLTLQICTFELIEIYFTQPVF